MSKLDVKSESLPQRCEICHQSDQFVPMTGDCSRCSSISIGYVEDGEFSIDVRALQLFYYISGGAGIFLGYISWLIFYSFCNSINRLLYPQGTLVLSLIGLVVGGLIGWGIFNYFRRLRFSKAEN